jgi:hypothetical protein
MADIKPPTCISCAHHRKTFFGRHWCYGYVSRDNVTGVETIIPDTCRSMRATHAWRGIGAGSSALCGPEGRLWKPKDG